MDLSSTIIPKSTQLNADDLIAGPITITITRVTANPGSDQPVAISYEGDEGRPYLPCKSMRRVLVQAWGKDGSQYPGRSLTLYRDPTVTWGGIAIGGIRISHMSDIDKERTMALTATKSSRKIYKVQPLKGGATKRAESPRDQTPERADRAFEDQGAGREAVAHSVEETPPPAEDEGGPFAEPPKKPFVFRIKNSKGELHSTEDGEKWATTLSHWITDSELELARAIYERNADLITEAFNAGEHVHATRVEKAWKLKKRENA